MLSRNYLSSTATKLLLNEGFAFGVGTAAYQIEGAVGADGRTDSVWDTFCRMPGKIADQSSGEVACDHYHRWKDDVELLSNLSVDVYRFSISWNRLFPEDSNTVNKKGLLFYKRLAETLRERGIRPMVTLHHWDLPQYLQDMGGWQNRVTAYRFTEFAKAVAEGLGESVDFYTTINEPWVIAYLGHRLGIHAPGICDEKAVLPVTHHLLLGHGLAVQALRDSAPSAEVGIVLNGGPTHPLTNSTADVDASRCFELEQIHSFASPLFRGKYPEEFAERLADFVQADDMKIIAAPCDYLGWNYYTRNIVRSGSDGLPEGVVGREYPITDMGWEIYPDGLREIINTLSANYDLPPLYISENGAAFEDTLVDNVVHDQNRIDYILSHLEVVAELLASGLDIRGYICWSLLDNFEWAEGYEKRFGLVHVDYETQKRTIKESGKVISQLLRGRKKNGDRLNQCRAAE